MPPRPTLSIYWRKSQFCNGSISSNFQGRGRFDGLRCCVILFDVHECWDQETDKPNRDAQNARDDEPHLNTEPIADRSGDSQPKRGREREVATLWIVRSIARCTCRAGVFHERCVLILDVYHRRDGERD